MYVTQTEIRNTEPLVLEHSAFDFGRLLISWDAIISKYLSNSGSTARTTLFLFQFSAAYKSFSKNYSVEINFMCRTNYCGPSGLNVT